MWRFLVVLLCLACSHSHQTRKIDVEVTTPDSTKVRVQITDSLDESSQVDVLDGGPPGP